jgi:SH3-like domain-containing protein
VPAFAFFPELDVLGRVGAWLNGPPSQTAAAPADLVGATRPQRGFVPGAPTPAPDAPPPTLQPLSRPTAAPTATPVAAPPAGGNTGAALASASGTRTGVVRSGSRDGVIVRRAAGVESPNDPRVPDGSPVLVSSGPELEARGERWRAIRGLNGVAGWVPSSQVQVDGEQPPNSAAAASQSETGVLVAEQARVANTGGAGVTLRRTPRDEDRSPAGLRDGTEVEVQERFGPDWARVRASNGAEGWVPSRYLAPAT